MKISLYIAMPIIFICASNALDAMDNNAQTPSQQWISELSKDTPDLTIIEKLALQKTVDVNKTGIVCQNWSRGNVIFAGVESKKYAILEAASKWNWRLVSILLNAGANPNVSFDFPHNLAGFTPLHFATEYENIEEATPIALALIAKGASVNARDKWFGQSPLRQAISLRNTSIIEALLAKGAQTNVPDYNKTTDEQAAQLLNLDLDALRPH